MDTFRHILLSLLLLPLYFVFGSYVFIMIAASVLIDLDHLSGLIRHRKYYLDKYEGFQHLISKIKEVYDTGDEYAYKGQTFIFHSLEFNVFIALLSLIFPILGFVSAGLLFHILIDISYYWYQGQPVVRWLSYIYTRRLLLEEKAKETLREVIELPKKITRDTRERIKKVYNTSKARMKKRKFKNQNANKQ